MKSYILLLILLFFGSYLKAQQKSAFKPGELWYDTNTEVINAHGGGILFDKGKYYWFGEKRGIHASEGVNVYSSSDLYNWNPEGLALATEDDPHSDITKGCVMERPKVLYNKATNKYVMWFHLELKGQGYKAARAAVAVSNNITGPYKFVKSFRPNEHMSRDMALFRDDDGTAYEIYSSRENYDLCAVRLTDDYLAATAQDTLLFSNHREAPALFKYQGNYYLITSGCTGWAPNEASLHVAKSIFGPWKLLGNPIKGPGFRTTFGAQSTYILPVEGIKDAFIFIADKWNPKDLKDSRHIWLPVNFKNQQPYIQWIENWDLTYFNQQSK